MLDLHEAQARVLEGVRPLGAERVLLDDVVGRVLAEELISGVALPAFDYSAMDGYAIDHASGTEAPRVVLHESRAGGPTPPALEPGTAMRIFTGAPLPTGADTIVMQEETAREENDEKIRLTGKPKLGDHVRRRGEDLSPGAVALARGVRLRPTHVPLLLALEKTRPAVVRRPVVAILATGDELREPGEPARPGSILETNGPAVAAMVRAAGGEPRLLPIVRDEVSVLRAAVEDALAGADVVLTIGGVSVGDHDLVKPVLAEAGVVLDFWKVAIRPGKPLAVGRRGTTTVLGLPGNPVSALVTFVLFAAPLIRALGGDPSPLPRTSRARLARALRHSPGRLELVRVRLDDHDAGELVATPLTTQSSGSVPSIAWADGLLIVPKESTGAAEGEELAVLRLDR